MKEQRLMVFRSAVDGLIESLDAVVRLARWNDSEPKPDPLVSSASKLVERLGQASRLAAARYQGTATEVTKADQMRVILKRLDAAYLAYRQELESPHGADAAAALETELAATTEAAASFR